MTLAAASEEPILHLTQLVRQVMESVNLAAARRTTVLVTGESAAGLEFVARAIGRRGDGADAPFVTVDCAQLPGDELESALFGVAADEAGGGTGRPDEGEPLTRGSHLYQAAGGTLFLRHAARMSAAVQARLARVLEQRAVILHPAARRVGVNLRLVVAGDPGCTLTCSDGRIPAGLFASKGAMQVVVPPLDTRPEDIPALAAELLKDLCEDAKVPHKTLTSLSQLLLAAAVRDQTALELRFFLEGLVGRIRGRVIRAEDLLAALFADAPIRPPGTTVPLRDAREQFERAYIASVIQRHRGRIPHAARALGMQRENLYRKLRHLDLKNTG
jgi:DNA-binding NtrC family response regulator